MPSILSLFLEQGPACFVYVLGLVWAVAHWKVNPKPARLVIVGMILLLVESIFVSAGGDYLMVSSIHRRSSLFWLREFELIQSAISGLIRAAGVACLIRAAFAARNSFRSESLGARTD